MNTLFTAGALLLTGSLTIVAALAPTAAFACADPAEAAAPAETPRPIDLAICLDTSGSMDGLIDAARQKLWAIVNDLALAKPTPELRVALLTFGNDGHNAEDGWVAVQTPFTGDLDLVSEKLFALSTNGGTEYVGRVLRNAGRLQWHPSEDALKLVIVAGNESANQDQEATFETVCRDLIGKGIMVNSIYCGPAADDLAPDWMRVAQLADGKFASIDQNQGTIVIESPFDEQLRQLSAAVNATYIPYGANGQRGLANQAAQDANAVELNSAAVASRCSTKGSVLYQCGSWDLVDACGDEGFKLADVKVEDLPESMQAMSPQERAEHIDKMRDERARVHREIAKVNQQRTAFIQAEMKRRSLDEADAFDNAVRKAIREQASTKGFSFEQAKTDAASEGKEVGG